MNLEDSNKDGSLMTFTSQIASIRAARAAADKAGLEFVINARTDAFAAPGISDRLGEAVKRANAYLEAGASCAFVPFVADAGVIAQLAEQIKGPLNILYGVTSPSLAELEKMGVRRASLGSGPCRAAYARARDLTLELMSGGTCKALEGAIPYSEMQSIFGK
jgi:2-methylisocitrate lyase-like PEP mutase family enzyme